MKRLHFALATILLLIIEIFIGMYASGWVRNYLGDVLVVILLYTLFRSLLPAGKPSRLYALPTAILIFVFAVEFLQLWGFCDRFGITNRLLRIIIGTGFSPEDLLSYAIGSVPCYIVEFQFREKSVE